jgi:hypothetical protein
MISRQEKQSSLAHMSLTEVLEDQKHAVSPFLRAVYNAQPGEKIKLTGISVLLRVEFVILLEYFYTEKLLRRLSGA